RLSLHLKVCFSISNCSFSHLKGLFFHPIQFVFPPQALFFQRNCLFFHPNCLFSFCFSRETLYEGTADVDQTGAGGASPRGGARRSSDGGLPPGPGAGGRNTGVGAKG